MCPLIFAGRKCTECKYKCHRECEHKVRGRNHVLHDVLMFELKPLDSLHILPGSACLRPPRGAAEPLPRHPPQELPHHDLQDRLRRPRSPERGWRPIRRRRRGGRRGGAARPPRAPRRRRRAPRGAVRAVPGLLQQHVELQFVHAVISGYSCIICESRR